MATMTIHNLGDDLKRRLHVQAAEHSHSMEEEARAILRVALPSRRPLSIWPAPYGLASSPWGAWNWTYPPRDPMPDPPRPC